MTAGRVPDEWVEAAAKAIHGEIVNPVTFWSDWTDQARAAVTALMPLVEAERDELLAEVERLRAEVAELRTNRCDNFAPTLNPHAPSVFCVRPQDHGGWHEAESTDGLPPMRWISDGHADLRDGAR